MKCIVITIMLVGISAFAFSQSTATKPGTETKSSIPQKNSKSDSASHRPEISVISIIPTLRFWLLPANIPNPFMKDDN